MAKVRYVGAATSEILDTPFQFKRYGQLVEMPDDLVAHALINGLSLLTDAEFQELGHTETELAKYGDFRSYVDAPADFVAKRAVAWQKVHENRIKKAEPVPAKELPAVAVESVKENING